MLVVILDITADNACGKSANKIEERRCRKRDAYISEEVRNEYEHERERDTEHEKRGIEKPPCPGVRQNVKPASYRKRSFPDNRIVLHKIDHSDSRKDQSRTADNGNDEKSEALIADTCNDRTDRYSEEV